jgi:hypothetical protein
LVEWGGLLIAAAALGYTVWSNWTLNNKINKQEDEQFASFVDLGEVPSDVYNSAEFKEKLGDKRDDDVWWAVINPSPVAIRGVWVEGSNGEFVRIGEIQRCTLYALHQSGEAIPVDFAPSAIHFKDPKGEWRLSVDGDLDKDKYEDTPSGDDYGDARDLSMETCV